jgi:hypothetical protein
MKRDPFFVWTVYDKPSDAPHCFVARRFEIKPEGLRATGTFMIGPDLDIIREQLLTMGLIPLARNEEDDSKIVETWI